MQQKPADIGVAQGVSLPQQKATRKLPLEWDDSHVDAVAIVTVPMHDAHVTIEDWQQSVGCIWKLHTRSNMGIIL
jgi:hypothetical protein